MYVEQINRPAYKADCKTLLRGAQVHPKAFVALYLAVILLLNVLDQVAAGENVFSIFVSLLTWMVGVVIGAGFVLYCMTIRRHQRAEFMTLFDGFTFAGKLIALSIVKFIFIALWGLLFVVPGIIAAYRYSFAVYNLCEHPDMGIMEALNLSKSQTYGYKMQLFLLDLSYIGWSILTILPEYVYFVCQLGTHPINYYTQSLYEQMLSMTMPLPVFILCGLWALAVQLFYLPTYECVCQAYFDTAKRTSGAGMGGRTPEY